MSPCYIQIHVITRCAIKSLRDCTRLAIDLIFQIFEQFDLLSKLLELSLIFLFRKLRQVQWKTFMDYHLIFRRILRLVIYCFTNPESEI